MTLEQAKEEYEKYIRAIERREKNAFCKKCGDLKFTPVIMNNQITRQSKDGGEIVINNCYVALKPCACTDFKEV